MMPPWHGRALKSSGSESDRQGLIIGRKAEENRQVAATGGSSPVHPLLALSGYLFLKDNPQQMEWNDITIPTGLNRP